MLSYKMQDEQTIELDMIGEVTAQDYQAIKPQLEGLMREKGKIKFLINLKELKSFGPGAIWEDIKFDLQNLKNVGTTAILGDKKTQSLMTRFIDMIFPERVRYFEINDRQGALNWLGQH